MQDFGHLADKRLVAEFRLLEEKMSKLKLEIQNSHPFTTKTNSNYWFHSSDIVDYFDMFDRENNFLRLDRRDWWGDIKFRNSFYDDRNLINEIFEVEE